jgi:site-specific recombinase XerC
VVPAIVAAGGEHAARKFIEFFVATIRNKNTRAAYHRAAMHFFTWLERNEISQLADIEPVHVGTYIEQLGELVAKPTVKLHLAAIRHLFDRLVTGQVLATNPAHAVHGPKHVVKRGKTPVLTADQARRLLESIDVSTVVGLRDRALIAVMTYAFARISAVGGGVRERERDLSDATAEPPCWSWGRSAGSERKLSLRTGRYHGMPCATGARTKLYSSEPAEQPRQRLRNPVLRAAKPRT